LYSRYVIKPKDIPESYWDNQRRLAREQGHGDIEVTDEMKEQQAKILITDQKSSLDAWFDYLASKDATYPDWLKYFAMRSVLGMGEYDKEKKQFSKRSKGTVKPFPDLDREALAYVLDALNKKYDGKNGLNLSSMELTVDDQAKLEQLLKDENFAKLYAWAIEKVTPASREQLANTKGEWVTYKQGSDHMPLVKSLQGHGTGWCTAGESTAQTQLKAGDFHVYYSLNQDGKPKIPRAAIRMQGNSIAEVRGIAPDQNLDPYIGGVVQKKMTEFPDGKEYEKKAADMKRLTEIEDKTKKGLKLTKDDLVFLYEIDQPIEGFGYEKDPRIDELRSQRDKKEDAPIVLACSPEQIAWKKEDVDENTKAYIGPLFPGVFDLNLEHLYTAFPGKKIRHVHFEIGGKTPKQYETELESKGFQIDGYGQQILAKIKTAKERQELDFVRLTVKDLGFDETPPYSEICRRAAKLGLDLSPAEAGPAFRLSKTDEPIGEWTFTAMDPIASPFGHPLVFYVERHGDARWLGARHGGPDFRWHPDSAFLFLRRK
jgi:hypothetical protein